MVDGTRFLLLLLKLLLLATGLVHQCPMCDATVVLLVIYMLTALCVSHCVVLLGIYLHVPC